MKTENIIKVEMPTFSFEELSESAKEKAIQDYRNSGREFFYNGVHENFIEKCGEYGIEVERKDINWTGFWSQGDGASFVSDNIDVKTLVDKLGIKFRLGLEKVFCENVNVRIKRIGHHYAHAYTVQASVETYDASYGRDNSLDRINEYIEKKAAELEEKLEELKNELCGTLYRDLEKEYDYQNSDDYIKEEFIANGDRFFENGSNKIVIYAE